MAGEAGDPNDLPKRRSGSQLSNGNRKRPRSLSSRRPPSARSTTLRTPDLDSSDARPASHMRSFADLVGAGTSRAEFVLGDDAPDDAWANIANTLDNLGSASMLPALVDGAEDSRSRFVRNGAGRGKAEDEGGGVLPEVIVDLSLKTRVHVSSASELGWALRRGQSEEFDALQSLLEGGRSKEESRFASERGLSNGVKRPARAEESRRDEVSDAHVDAAKKRLYEALVHFRFPTAPLPLKMGNQWQDLTANYGKTAWQVRPDTDAQTLAAKRVLDWQNALQSLYFGYRYGRIPSFYVVLSTTTVIFNHGRPLSVSEDKRRTQSQISAAVVDSPTKECPRACFAKASAGVRSLLSEYEVPFTLIEGSLESDEVSVVVEGLFAVHTLYNFLLSFGPKLSNARDVPILLADRAFRGATIAAAEIINVRTALASSEGEDELVEQHTLQIRGMFTPRQIAGICQALAVTQEGEFEAHFETEDKSAMLNNCGHGRGDVEDGEKDGNGAYCLRGPYVLSRIRMVPSVEGFSYFKRDSR